MTVALTFIFAPLAVLFAIVTTFGLMTVSYRGTYDFFSHSLGMAKQASYIISNILTWGFATLVNGALYTKNLIVAAGYFADKIGKFFSGIGYTFGFMFLMISQGTFIKAIGDMYRAFRDNPMKAVFPGILSAILLALASAVVLNAMGNAWEYRDHGTFPLPDSSPISGKLLTFISAFFGSATLNFMAIVAAVANVPIKKLPADAGKSTYGKTKQQLLDPIEEEEEEEEDNNKPKEDPNRELKPGAANDANGFNIGLLIPKFRNFAIDKGKITIGIEMTPLNLPMRNPISV